MANEHLKSVIGIDFGTTNTYLTVCPYGTKNKFPVHFSGRSPSVDTAILYADKVASDSAFYPIIGEAASLTYGQASLEEREEKGYRYHANFKPEISGQEIARNCAVDFFKAFLREARRVGVSLDSKENSIIIGAPSEAGEDFRKTLREVMERAGLGPAEIVDEPKGVLLTDLGYNRFPLGDILDGYLVIDFGGGTCDFALMKKGEVVGSWGDMELGGRLFDDLFYQWFLEQNPNLEEKLKKERRDFYVWSYLCRRIKEDFSETVARNPEAKFTAEVGRFGLIKDLSVPEFLAKASNHSPSEAFLSHSRSIGATSSEKLMAGSINLIAWFTDLLKSGLKDHVVKAVSLSGGSSNWFFVMEVCRSLLGLSADRIMASPNPFGAISEGLAILPAIKTELDSAQTKMMATKDAFVKNELMPRVEANLQDRSNRLADMITLDLFDAQIIPVFKQTPEDNFVIVDVEAKITELVDAYQDRLRQTVKKEMGEELLALKTIIQSKVQAWLDSFGLRLDGRVSTETTPGGQVEIDRPLIVDRLAKPLVAATNGFVSAWTGLIAASLCGGSGVALVASGPLGLLIGALGGAWLGRLGLKLGRSQIERFTKGNKLPKFLVETITSDKNIAKVRSEFKNDLLKKVNAIHKEILSTMPQEIDLVIVNEINQLGIINVF
ncbi:MAG: Hsp70 family protein [Deltaproteobacteria bacterium]|jgi:hypothetical protein|nr:Hsp70 family protein [Deltaproteobacteria bacterium]